MALNRGNQRTHLRSIKKLVSMAFTAIFNRISTLTSANSSTASVWPYSSSPPPSASAASLEARHEKFYHRACDQSINKFLKRCLLLILSTNIFRPRFSPSPNVRIIMLLTRRKQPIVTKLSRALGVLVNDDLLNHYFDQYS